MELLSVLTPIGPTRGESTTSGRWCTLPTKGPFQKGRVESKSSTPRIGTFKILRTSGPFCYEKRTFFLRGIVKRQKTVSCFSPIFQPSPPFPPEVGCRLYHSPPFAQNGSPRFREFYGSQAKQRWSDGRISLWGTIGTPKNPGKNAGFQSPLKVSRPWKVAIFRTNIYTPAIYTCGILWDCGFQVSTFMISIAFSNRVYFYVSSLHDT